MASRALASTFLVSFAFLGGCSVQATSVPTDDPPVTTPTTETTPAPPPRAPATVAPATPTPVATTGEHAEVVYLNMRDRRGQRWFCTATLIARDRVVTAAHCLDKDFVAYEITAPFVTGKPRIKASAPQIFGGDFHAVENPDIGTLTLETPLDLPRFAELTNVVERLEAGPVLGVAVVRTAEEPTAPMAPSAEMPVSSAAELGYAYGITTPMFSKGGDSGAGLFLVENGKTTHKLIGVARQPEPARTVDHFTRIDGELIAWNGAHTK